MKIEDYLFKFKNDISKRLTSFYEGMINLKEKGFVQFFNPTSKTISKTIALPLYYTSLTDTAKIREKEGAAKSYTLNRDYTVQLNVTVPANSNTWYVIE